MQVKSIAECFIKLPFVIKIFVLSIFEWLLKTGFTVAPCCFTKISKLTISNITKIIRCYHTFIKFVIVYFVEQIKTSDYHIP